MFIPKSFSVPKKTDMNNMYFLVPITTQDVMEDWLVLTNNAETIFKTRGGRSRKEWPFVCSLEENYKDLAWLELSAEYKQLFSFIIRKKSNLKYVGCVYIYPIDLFYPEKKGKFDVDFSFWITKKEFDKGNYEMIFELLYMWLIHTWPFKKERIYLRNKLIPKKIAQ